MSTKPAPSIKNFSEQSLENIAYKSVEKIPTQEMNDKFRLGYHVYLYLKEENHSPLLQYIKNAGARILISESEAMQIINEELQKYSLNK